MAEVWSMGVDVGSVSVKVLLLDQGGNVRFHSYHRTMGAPLPALVEAVAEARASTPPGISIGALGTTGSGRELAGALLGADVIKNEITTHAIGALQWNPSIRTVIEIGGQDSKIIHLRDGMVTDFAMNSICAAGTGAFLDQQAVRLQIPIERLGEFALTAPRPVRIAGRCSVFAESDMIHKQQAGHDRAGICLGLCEALVRNYLNNVAGGRPLESPISFQGGVARNQAILHCFRQALPGAEIVLPPLCTACGALGSAILAREECNGLPTRFRGWLEGEYAITEETCPGCSNECDHLILVHAGRQIARWGGKCGKHKVSSPPARRGRAEREGVRP